MRGESVDRRENRHRDAAGQAAFYARRDWINLEWQPGAMNFLDHPQPHHLRWRYDGQRFRRFYW